MSPSPSAAPLTSVGASAEIAQPWYRYFWPWLVIALLGSAVAASLASAYLAVRTQDSVVAHGDASQ